MQTDVANIVNLALALPPIDRELVAHRIWESLASVEDLDSIITEARRRDAELQDGTVVGRSHEEVIAAARRAIRCE